MWYPAKTRATMKFGEYLRSLRAPAMVADGVKWQETYSADSLKNAVGNNGDAFRRLQSSVVPAMTDAQPAAGSFPVVVYGLGQNDHLAENTVLGEFLASHGYVVVTASQFGTNERRKGLFIDDAASYDAQVRDLEFALNSVPASVHPDRSRVAAVGMSMGGIYTLLLAMQNPSIRAIVGLDPTYVAQRASYEYDFTKMPYYDSGELTIPLLALYRHDDQRNLTVPLDLKRSDRYFVDIPNSIHADFTSYPWITESISLSLLDTFAASHRSQAQAMKTLDYVDQAVLAFLDSTVKGTGLFVPLQSNLGLVRHEGAMRTPTEEQLAGIAAKRGFESAAEVLNAALVEYPAQDIERFAVLNRIGYEYIYTNRAALAVDIFKLNVLSHPANADAYESLGEGYEALNDSSKAKQAFLRALAIDPLNKGAQAELAKLAKP